VDCQARVGEAFLETARWTRMSILNSARVGRFSSDRSISEYCRDIWNVRPVEIEP
jgi:starch phosphorylase